MCEVFGHYFSIYLSFFLSPLLLVFPLYICWYVGIIRTWTLRLCSFFFFFCCFFVVVVVVSQTGYCQLIHLQVYNFFLLPAKFVVDPSCLFFVKDFIFFRWSLYQHGAWTHNPDIKSCMFYWLTSQTPHLVNFLVQFLYFSFLEFLCDS